jgi:hypothetical protein
VSVRFSASSADRLDKKPRRLDQPHALHQFRPVALHVAHFGANFPASISPAQGFISVAAWSSVPCIQSSSERHQAALAAVAWPQQCCLQRPQQQVPAYHKVRDASKDDDANSHRHHQIE